MSQSPSEFGLTAGELQQLVAQAMQGWNEALAASEEYVTPAEYTARRLAWEAAAALIAANNRRLNEQLRQLGAPAPGPAVVVGRPEQPAPAAPVAGHAGQAPPH